MGNAEKKSRNQEIYERVFNGERPTDLARVYGISASRISQIYNKKWKEHCQMGAYEAVRKSVGKNRLMQTGPSTYKGEWHRPDGKVKTKSWTMERPDAEENWLAWMEECEAEWEERHDVPHKDDDVVNVVLNNPVRSALVSGPEPGPEPEPLVEPEPEPVVADKRNRMYLLHRTDWKGTPTLFSDCDKALGVASNLAKVTGCDFDVLEVAFWEEV